MISVPRQACLESSGSPHPCSRHAPVVALHAVLIPFASMTSPPRCLFLARVAHVDLLESVEFYREDLATLDQLGYEVQIAIRNRDAIRARRPALVYCWWQHSALLTIIAWRLRGVPVVVTGALHFKDPGHRSARGRVRKLASCIGAAMATLNIAISQVEEHDLRFLPRTRRVEVPLGVDTQYYTGAGRQGPPSAVTIGQLNPVSIHRKGIDVVIAAVPLIARDLPDFHLHVVGLVTPEGERMVRDMVAAGDPERTTVHGAVSRARKLEILRASDLYLQASTFEGFGLSALEALSCGVPVIHSGRGSLPEVVGDAGISVPDRTPEAFAAAIVSYYSEPSARATLPVRARQQAESLSRDARTDRLSAVLAEVTRRSRRPGRPTSRVAR